MSEDRELILAIVMGLRRGMKIVRGLRKQVTEPDEFSIASHIADQLAVSNYRIERGPPVPGHAIRPLAKPTME
jgi:hypothetical protein